MRKLTLNDVKNFKYVSGEWTLNGENLFTTLDEQYKVDFMFKVNNDVYKADIIIYAYGVGPAIQYKDEHGNDRIYAIRNLLLDKKDTKEKVKEVKETKEPSPEILQRYNDAQTMTEEEFETLYGIPKHFYE